jgi:AcrR family transcriptional regulator
MKTAPRGSAGPAGIRARRRAPALPPEERRPLVLDAALTVFLERGYDGASMEAIARAVGVTKPVLYSCYTSKPELFKALLDREERRVLTHVASAMPTVLDETTLSDLVRASFSAFFVAVAAAPDSYRAALLAERGSDLHFASRVQRGRDAAAAQIAGLAEGLLNDHGFPTPRRTAELVGHAVVGVGEALARQLAHQPERWKPEEMTAVATGLVTRGAQTIVDPQR